VEGVARFVKEKTFQTGFLKNNASRGQCSAFCTTIVGCALLYLHSSLRSDHSRAVSGAQRGTPALKTHPSLLVL